MLVEPELSVVARECFCDRVGTLEKIELVLELFLT